MGNAKTHSLLAALSAGGCLVAGCGGSGSAPDTTGNVSGLTCRPLTRDVPSQTALDSPFQGTVFTIVLENKSRDQMLDGTQAPFLRSLAQEYAVANGYTDTGVHPSEPNYIWMASGQNFGILDNDPPALNHIASTSHLVDQIERVGKTWRAYQESMGTPCKVVSEGRYAVKHNPFVFFDDLVAWNGSQAVPSQRCIDHVVDYAELDKDLASGEIADYVFITPDMISDMHDGSIAQGDAWLAREVPKIMASPAYQNGGVLIITADEGEGQGDDPPFVLISPLGKRGYTSDVAYDTSSFLKTVQAILGVEALPCSASDPASVATMDDLFAEPLPAM